MPESIAPGCALFDYDGDDDLDVYAVSGYRLSDGGTDRDRAANRLYRRNADGTYTDVTEASGAGHTGYGIGVAVGDVDNDGDLDLYLTNYGEDALLRNNGDGTFTDVTREAGISNPAWAASAGFCDYDKDGFLDIYVANYVLLTPGVTGKDDAGRPEYPGPESLPGLPDRLYHNRGDGTFEDVSGPAGIAESPGRGLGVLFTDLDEDGLPDIYVANDREANYAWIQQTGGSFVDRAFELGLAVNGNGSPEAGMGIAPGDPDGDLDLDMLVTHFTQETHTLYRNDGEGTWTDATWDAGLAAPTINVTGWGTAFVDLDHDGDQDLLAVNGRVLRAAVHPGARLTTHWNPYAEPNQVFLNTGSGHFTELGASCGDFCSHVEVSHGLATGDVDRDGDMDFLVANGNGTIRLYRNDMPRSNRWLQVHAMDPGLRRDAIGARIDLLAGGREQVRWITRSSSYCSASAAVAHFGLGQADQVERITVTWPDGASEHFGPFEVDTVIVLQKGAGRAR